MAQNRTPYVAIDDTQVDAESPITESLMFGVRDQWWAAIANTPTLAPDTDRVQLPERAKTDETDTSLALAPDGAGGVVFSTLTTLLGDATAFSASIGQGASLALYTVTEIIDVGSWLNDGTDTATVPANKGGTFMMTFEVLYDGSGANNFTINPRHNGASISNMGGTFLSGTASSLTQTRYITLAATDTLDLFNGSVPFGSAGISGLWSVHRVR